MSADEQRIRTTISSSVADGSFCKAVLSKPIMKAVDKASRIDARPILMKGNRLIQLTQRIGNQDHHQNLSAEAASQFILDQMKLQFLDVFLSTTDGEYTARFSRKGICRLQIKEQKSETATAAVPNSHNLSKNYLIPDGTPCPFLIATGVMTAEGKVKAKHYRKFRQINRYVEIVRDIVSQLPDDQTIRIVDFGCGKSYLTFATHHLLTSILKRKVDIRGLDQRADVVNTCQKIVERLELNDLTFQRSMIADYEPDQHIHLVISLHACDTATDDALANAVQWKSEVILAVPCCQHELASKLDKSAEPVFSDSGILHERFAALATDALRAQWMRVVGYETSVMEFIDMQHTAKNLLIKAVRQPDAGTLPQTKTAMGQIAEFQKRMHIEPLRLENQLKQMGQIPSDETQITAVSEINTESNHRC
ncbi:MAG: SAM-dependent methyltransferase [Fuerstiella sp.]